MADFHPSSVVMCWNEEGYQLLWTDPVPARREVDNDVSSYEQYESISSVVL